jgi:hypothetical protein
MSNCRKSGNQFATPRHKLNMLSRLAGAVFGLVDSPPVTQSTRFGQDVFTVGGGMRIEWERRDGCTELAWEAVSCWLGGKTQRWGRAEATPLQRQATRAFVASREIVLHGSEKPQAWKA